MDLGAEEDKLSLILDLKQLRKLNLCENCDFNKQITFAILSERPCICDSGIIKTSSLFSILAD